MTVGICGHQLDSVAIGVTRKAATPAGTQPLQAKDIPVKRRHGSKVAAVHRHLAQGADFKFPLFRRGHTQPLLGQPSDQAAGVPTIAAHLLDILIVAIHKLGNAHIGTDSLGKVSE